MYDALKKIDFMGLKAIANEEARLRQMQQHDWLAANWSEPCEDEDEAYFRKCALAPITLVLEWEGKLPEGFKWPDLPKRLSADCPSVAARFESLMDYGGLRSMMALNEALIPTMRLSEVVEGNSEKRSDTETATEKTPALSDGLDSTSEATSGERSFPSNEPDSTSAEESA